MMFEGILLFQVYIYWRAYHNKDTTVYQILVYFICILELFHSIATVHAGYWYLIRNFGKHEELVKLVWSIIVELALTVIVSFIGRAEPQESSAFSVAQLLLGILEVYEGVRSPFFATIVDGKVCLQIGLIMTRSSYMSNGRRGLGGPNYFPLAMLLLASAPQRDTKNRASAGPYYNVRGYEGFFDVNPSFLVFSILWLVNVGISSALALEFDSYSYPTVYTNALLATLNSREYIVEPIATQSDTGVSFVLTSVVASPFINNPEVHDLADMHSNSRFSDIKNPRHIIPSPTSSGTSGAQTSTGNPHSDINSIPTYHASLRDT
ncbi:hypothetical protein BU17DRAFT_64669 [Hysterangium stoloniferum]|nr:hypothetical protein BU17DRAFT_64669 [Hysterangium stoloniferum]